MANSEFIDGHFHRSYRPETDMAACIITITPRYELYSLE